VAGTVVRARRAGTARAVDATVDPVTAAARNRPARASIGAARASIGAAGAGVSAAHTSCRAAGTSGRRAVSTCVGAAGARECAARSAAQTGRATGPRRRSADTGRSSDTRRSSGTRRAASACRAAGTRRTAGARDSTGAGHAARTGAVSFGNVSVASDRLNTSTSGQPGCQQQNTQMTTEGRAHSHTPLAPRRNHEIAPCEKLAVVTLGDDHRRATDESRNNTRARSRKCVDRLLMSETATRSKIAHGCRRGPTRKRRSARLSEVTACGDPRTQSAQPSTPRSF
jgi:hypothetical protein